MSNRVLAAALVAWAAALAVGFTALWRYKAAAAVQDDGPPLSWPAGSAVGRTPARATLVLFAHPRCPCTHASVTELGRLMARLGGSLAARVLVVRPTGVGPDWDDTALVSRAAAIPGVAVATDEGGTEAARFGARTSGFTVLYDASGRRLFRGGITSARGHEGDSFGSQRIVSLLTTGKADRADAPTFGCALAGPETPVEEATR